MLIFDKILTEGGVVAIQMIGGLMEYSYMKATKKKKYSYEKDKDVPRKKYSYEKDRDREIARAEKMAKKGLKKVNILLAVLFLAIGVLVGFFGLKFAFGKDTFKLNEGTMVNEIMYIGEGEAYQKYEELGVTCVSFGKDYSKDYTVKYYYRADLTEEATEVSKVDEAVPGMYYAVYTTKAPRYKSVTLIRNIAVLGEES